MKVLPFSPIIALVTLTTINGCQYADTILESKLKKEPSEVMQKLFNIETDRQFYITFPDHKNQVALTEFVSTNNSQDSKPYVRGVLADNKNYSASLDYSNITVLNGSKDKNIVEFIAPYTLTNSNAASDETRSTLDNPNLPSNSLYLGFFELDYNTNNITQYDQQLLGKYSALTAIDYDGQKTVDVTIRQYPTQADQNKNVRSSVHDMTFKVSEEMMIDNVVGE
ncbi:MULTISPECIES: hypothetical protein [unclassified Psychrobacter]|uniref:hypothetical protein n=1 Tax=unclassified Psychrobacter TaxID=196806 RepID=UPI000715A9E9|nr:hypothetical protein [Psychrobacter sp. P11F6]KRG34795.1 hypothetical protein AK822_08120 [Psychrobacter sp. P11F6]